MNHSTNVHHEHIGVKWGRAAAYCQSALRIVAAFVFMLHGTSKLWAWPASMLPGGGTAKPLTLPWEGGLIEVFGGGLVLLGVFTRPIAFVLSGEMAFAYFNFHRPRGFWPTVNGGVAAVLFCFIWLFISAAGAGPWSIDALYHRKR
jgi:putative oxidoreductase